MPTTTNRSITDGCNNTAGTGSSPTPSPNRASPAHAHSKDRARTADTATAADTTWRAKAATAAESFLGRQAAMTGCGVGSLAVVQPYYCMMGG